MKVIYRSVYTGKNITISTNDITSDCHTIAFDNFGADDIKISINNSDDFIIVKAGSKYIFGGRDPEIKLYDTFNITFLTSNSPGVNIVRENLQIIG